MRTGRAAVLLAAALLAALAAGVAAAAGGEGGSAPPSAAGDDAATAEAAIAHGQPAAMLVTFRVPEQAAASSASQLGGLPRSVQDAARRRAYAAAKARVLGAAAFSTGGAAAAATSSGSPAGARVALDFERLPVALVTLSTSAELARLRASPGVASVVPDGSVRRMQAQQGFAGYSLIGQPAVQAKGLLGRGTVVVIDSGVDYTRAAFGSCSAPGVPADKCRVTALLEFAAPDGVLDDGMFHGTNVAGIVLRVAPGASIIGIDVFDGATGSWSNILRAIDWAIASRDEHNITVINMSLGSEDAHASPCDTHPLAAAIASAHDAGIVSVVAAGNEGQVSGLSAPACAPKAVSVGAVYTTDLHASLEWGATQTPCRDDGVKADQVPCFSNSGEQLTLLAPGFDIAAAGVRLTGTSQAAPFVAGALVVLAERFPADTPDQRVERLVGTGVQILDPRNSLVKPRLNLEAAAGLNCSQPAVSCTPSTIRSTQEGGTFSLQCSAGRDCPWSVSVPGATPWLKLTGPTAGSGNVSLTLQLDATSGSSRSTGLVFAFAAEPAAAAGASAGDAGADAGGGGAVALSAAVLVVQTIDRARDRAPPVMGGLFSGIATRSVCELRWTPASDAGSGVARYVLVYERGNTAPAGFCRSGTPVRQEPALYNSTAQPFYVLRAPGLTNATRYTFRLCAVDGVGNTAVGSVWRGTTRA